MMPRNDFSRVLMCCLPLLVLLGGSLPAQAADPATWQPGSTAYVLQAERLDANRARAVDRLARCDRDLLILDVSYDGSDTGRWRTAELEQIRRARPGRRVVAYLSVGEAEDYRSYWQPSWKTQPPEFLLRENPQWRGNYLVRYWHPQWQTLMRDAAAAALAQGFDGLYLDRIDAYEDFERDEQGQYHDHQLNPQTHRSYRADMVRWVGALSELTHAQGKLLIPQNGSALLHEPGYLNLIDGIGLEDVFTDGQRQQPEPEVRHVLDALTPLRAAGRFVLFVEYARRAKLRAAVQSAAQQAGWPVLLTDRELTTLGQCFAPTANLPAASVSPER